MRRSNPGFTAASRRRRSCHWIRTCRPSGRSGRVSCPHDITSQAVALVADPDPGERWWDVNTDNGLHALHLASLMRGKGLVVCTFDERAAAASDRAKLRATPFRNITTRLWDGRHVAGKAGSFHGVLVDALSSGIGSCAEPDLRWTIFADQIPELAAQQLQCLDVASMGVRPGGTLVYTVATVTRRETIEVVNTLLEVHAETKRAVSSPLGRCHDQRYSPAVAANSRWQDAIHRADDTPDGAQAIRLAPMP